MPPIPARLQKAERDHWNRVVRSRLGLIECGNCGRQHVGFVETYYPPMEFGFEVDFIWTDWSGNARLCAKGHRRDPCVGHCWRCDYAVLVRRDE